MTLWNVSMIVAPNLFVYKGKRANQEEMLIAATTAHVVRLLIKYQEILWMVSDLYDSFHISRISIFFLLRLCTFKLLHSGPICIIS